MSKPNFNDAYVNANRLQEGSVFTFANQRYMVEGFASNGILFCCVDNYGLRASETEIFEPIYFEIFVENGMIKIED